MQLSACVSVPDSNCIVGTRNDMLPARRVGNARSRFVSWVFDGYDIRAPLTIKSEAHATVSAQLMSVGGPDGGGRRAEGKGCVIDVAGGSADRRVEFEDHALAVVE